ncbi:MAG: hypothetical protein HXY25_10675, partial [Alphaproteobacteria bacterium]|nr:hypothetical protein [Alphaproteobacteria bacterium]
MADRDRPTLILFVRAPVLGRVKTRLARALGGVTALRLYRAGLRAAVLRLGRDPRWRLVLAVT